MVKDFAFQMHIPAQSAQLIQMFAEHLNNSGFSHELVPFLFKKT